MNYFPLLASIQLGENDRRLLVILIIFLLLTMSLLGLLGYVVRKAMQFQAKRINSMCTKVLTTRVVCDEKSYRKYANKKSNILYFKQSVPAVLIGLLGLIVWITFSIIFDTWKENIFAHTINDLFFIFGVDERSTSWDFLNITFHSLVVVNNDGKGPQAVAEHIPFYAESLLFVTSGCWILVATQAFVSRGIAIQKFAKEASARALEGFAFTNIPNEPKPQSEPTTPGFPPQQ